MGWCFFHCGVGVTVLGVVILKFWDMKLMKRGLFLVKGCSHQVVLVARFLLRIAVPQCTFEETADSESFVLVFSLNRKERSET